jgi:hypothetical protein
VSARAGFLPVLGVVALTCGMRVSGQVPEQVAREQVRTAVRLQLRLSPIRTWRYNGKKNWSRC